MTPISVHLAVEDALSEAVLRAILAQSGRKYAVGAVYGKHGFGDLKRMTPGFNRAAGYIPFILLTDLDKAECPPILLHEWLPQSLHGNFLFRVAVREVESWVMAHRKAFAAFMGLPVSAIPEQPDTLADPKAELLRLAGRSRRRDLQTDLLPLPSSPRTQGPGYNSRLEEFIWKSWQVNEAAQCSPSLARTFERLKSFRPVWSDAGGRNES